MSNARPQSRRASRVPANKVSNITRTDARKYHHFLYFRSFPIIFRFFASKPAYYRHIPIKKGVFIIRNVRFLLNYLRFFAYIIGMSYNIGYVSPIIGRNAAREAGNAILWVQSYNPSRPLLGSDKSRRIFLLCTILSAS